MTISHALDTRLRSTHNASFGPLRAALQSLPGYPEAYAAAETLSTALESVRGRTAARTERDLAQDVVDAVHAGQPIPTDLGEQLRDVREQTGLWETQLAVLRGAGATLISELDSIVYLGEDQLLENLNEQLQVLVVRLRALDLASTPTASAAIRAHRGEQYYKAQDIGVAMTAVRSAQGHVLRYVAEDYIANEDTKGFALYRNYAALVPNWKHIGKDRTLHVGRPDTLPWPQDLDGAFTWLIGHPAAQPWVPTRSQLATARAAALREERDASGQSTPVNVTEMTSGDYRRRLASARAAHSIAHADH